MIQKFVKLLTLGSAFTNAAFTATPGLTCGVSNSALRVVGGQSSVDAAEFPWQAKFFPCFKRSPTSVCVSTICGATLISPLWLISAAHCTADYGTLPIDLAGSQIIVGNILGGTDALPSSEQRSLVTIKDHDEYETATDGHDITLLKVDSEIVFNSLIHPACLPVETDCFAEGSETWISGFGRTEEGGDIATLLQYVMVPIYNLNDCRTAYATDSEEDSEEEVEPRNENDLFDISTQVCAGLPEGGKDGCQGDSGGPLAVSYNDVWYLYGVTSYGIGCARAGKPGVYARVTNYVDFILSNTDGDIIADYALVEAEAAVCDDGAGQAQVSDAGATPGQSNGLLTGSSPCDDEPCQNDGICDENDDMLSHTCICPHEFIGTNCEEVAVPGTADEEYEYAFDNSNVNGALDFILGDNSQTLLTTTAEIFYWYRLSNVNFLIDGSEPARKRRDVDDVLDAIKEYGCWCPRALNGEGFGHAGVPLDDVDMFCKKWSQCNHCVSMNDCGSDSTIYTINFNPAADSYTCAADNQCALDMCNCNGEFATSVARYLSDNGQNLEGTFVNAQADQCEHGRTGGRKDACCGVSPTWVPYNSGVEQCGAGVLSNL